jgi:hypothetical protein
MDRLVAIRHQPVHQIQALVLIGDFRGWLFGIHGLRLLWGLRVAADELAGADLEPADAGSAGLETGNANVGAGDGDGVADELEAGDVEGLGVGLGVGEGIIFSHRCNGTLAPPISFTSVSQRSWILSRSGGPNGFSAVPGKMM